MKCQNLFSGKNRKKNILICRLLKILPRVLSVRRAETTNLLVNQLNYHYGQ